MAYAPASTISTSDNTYVATKFYIQNNRYYFKNLVNKLNIRADSAMTSYVSDTLTSNDINFVPQPGDLVYYRFIPSDHTSHVGFVYTVNTSGQTFTAIEGNKDNQVAYRSNVSYQVNGYSGLVGFARPVY